ncbi:MAG: META domain-containing protein [bacterium]|nr:META domain-containing protein [bacterium]
MKFVTLFLTTISLFLLGLATTSAQETSFIDPQLMDTQWQLVSYGSPDSPTPVIEGTTVTLIFDRFIGVNGNAGCNTYRTSYTISDLNEKAITFSMPMSTMMACVNDAHMEQELIYLQALQTVTSYELSPDQLILNYEGGQLIFMELRLASLANTEWQLVQYGTTDALIDVVGDTPITLKFEDEETVSGSGGCNSYGGIYSIWEGDISFSNVFSTEMACMIEGVMEQESHYLQALSTASTIPVMSVSRLVIDYGRSSQLIFEQFYSLVDTSWQLVSFDDTPVIENSVVTITFDEAFYIGGSGGCNDYGGRYGIRGDTISFYEVITTMMACPDDINAQEGSFFFGLEKATTYEISADELVIYYGEGAKMTFTRIENPYSE